MSRSRLAPLLGTAMLLASACFVSIPEGTEEGDKNGGCVYADTVLADGPVAYWRLDEPENGTVPIDRVTGSPHGAFEGKIVHGIPGRSGKAADFQPGAAADGNGRLVVGDELDFPGTAPFSLEVWIQPKLTDDKSRTVIGKADSPESGYLLFLSSSTINSIQVYRYIGVGNPMDKESKALPLPPDAFERWLHVVVTYDGLSLCLYLDGERLCTQPIPQECAANGASFSIGRVSAGFVGFIDEVAVYDYALSNVQISRHLTCGSGS